MGLLLFILLTAKPRFTTTDSSLVFYSERIFKPLSKKIEIKIDQIIEINYYRREVHPMIIMLPGDGGIKTPEFEFILDNGNIQSITLFYSRKEIDMIIDQIEKKTKIDVVKV